MFKNNAGLANGWEMAQFLFPELFFHVYIKNHNPNNMECPTP